MDTAVNDNQVSNNTAAGTETKTRPAYPLRGHMSSVEFCKDKNEKDYAKGKLTFVSRKDKRETTVTVMAFGKAYEDCKHLFQEGSVAIYGTFERNVFRAISPALPPKEDAEKAAA